MCFSILDRRHQCVPPIELIAAGGYRELCNVHCVTSILASVGSDAGIDADPSSREADRSTSSTFCPFAQEVGYLIDRLGQREVRRWWMSIGRESWDSDWQSQRGGGAHEDRRAMIARGSRSAELARTGPRQAE